MAHFYAIWGANIFEAFCDTFILPKTLIDKLHNKGLLLEKRSEAFYLVLLRFLVSIHTTIGGRK